MRITKQLDMDLSRRGVAQTLEAVQGDGNTRCVALRLFDGGTPWNVPAGVTAAVAFRKPDAHKGLYDTLPGGTAAVSVSGNTVTAILAPQVLTAAGEVQAAVVLHDANLNQLATFPFRVDVSPNPAAGSVLSNDYYKYSTMEAVSEAVDAALTALEESKQSFLSAAEEALAAVHDTATEAAPAIHCEATGSTVSVTDASDRLLRGLTLCGKTVQNGTPTPETPVPLETAGTGGAIGVTVKGTNLIPYPYVHSTKTENGITFTDNGDGSISVSGTATGAVSFYLSSRSANIGALSGLGRCTLSAGVSNENLVWTVLDGAGNPRIGLNTTYDFTGKTFALALYVSSGATVNTTVYPMLNIGETALPYEPYNAQTLTASTPGGLPGIPVSSGGNYTDENGQQWICDEVDFAKGVYVQRVNKNALTGNEYWGEDSNSFYAGCSPTKAPNTHSICTHMQVYGSNAHDIIYYRFTDSGISNMDEWKAWIAERYAAGTPVEVLYVLKTPIETPLSADELAQYAALRSNKPYTTVFNDAGAGMKLSYTADTKTYTDNRFNQLYSAILSAGANI